MIIPRLRYGLRKLPDAIMAELVTMLISGRVPVVVMMVTVSLVTVFATLGAVHPLIWSLSGIVLVLLAVRFGIVTRYMGIVRNTILSAPEVLSWERRYTNVIMCYAGALGLFNVVVTINGDAPTHLMVVAEIFGFCAGQVSRSSCRPRLCARAVLLSTIPTAIGMLVVAGRTQEFRESAAYLVVSLIIILYAVSSIETVIYNYRTLLAQLESKRQLAGLARLDPLTGLPNRLAFVEQLQPEVDRVHDGVSTVALHMIDLDGFKSVNDNYGHPAGDALLCQVAERLRRLLRTGDTVARLGGDEFVVIQRGIVGADEALLLGHRIVRQLADPYRIGENDVRIAASDGIAHAPGDTTDMDRLIDYADKALYKVKRNSGGGVGIWSAPETQTEHKAA